MDSRSLRTLPKSGSNTRISVLTGTTASAKAKSPAGNTSESTRLVYHHGGGALGSSNNAGYGGGGGGSSSRSSGGSSSRSHTRSSAPTPRGGGYGTGGGGVGAYQAVGKGTYQPLHGHYKNPVEECLHAGVTGFGWCMVAWLVGVVLLFIEYTRTWGHTAANANHSVRNFGSGGGRSPDGPSWLIFAPFWLGDLLAVAVLVRVLSKVASVRFATPHRNRSGMRRNADGRDRSTGSLSDLGGSYHGSNGSGSSCNTVIPVNLDYFPLIQRVVVTTVGALIVLVLVVVEQVLVCLWWDTEQERQRGRGVEVLDGPGPFALAAPVLTLAGLCLLRVLVLRTEGWLSGSTWALILLLTLSVAFKCKAEGVSSPSSNALHNYSWLACLAPLWVLDALYLAVAGYVAANSCAGRFVMAPTQGLCFALFVVALVGSTIAELLLTGDHRLLTLTDKVPREVYVRIDLQLLLAVGSLMAFCAAVFLSAEYSISMLVNTHGYDDPLPLCETPSGWEWSGAGKARWGLLGDVSVRAEKKVALPGGLAGNKGAAMSGRDLMATEDSFGNKAYQRTDSGQYVDIYDKL